MKKIILAFCMAWVVYSLINSGYAVSQLEWRKRLRQDPVAIQTQSGDIFTHGAYYLKNNDLNKHKHVVLFVESNLGFLHALPVDYLLYPTTFTPASNDPQSSGEATSKPDVALQKLISQKQPNIIYFIGQQKTLDYDTSALANYSKTLAAKENGQVFVVLEKR